MAKQDIPEQFQGACAVAGDKLDIRVAEERGLVSEYNGKQYYFCCPACKSAFTANPENYLRADKPSVTLTLKSKQHELDNIWSFDFETAAPMAWVAGQYVRLEIQHGNKDESTKRWFTIASAPFEKVIRVTTRISESSFKQALSQLAVGGSIEMIDLPGGDFVWEGNDQHERVFVIGGIGITPLLSIIRQRQHQDLPLNATVLYANRTDDVPFRDLLEASRERGLRTQYLAGPQLTVEKILDTVQTNTAQFYISGAKPMVEQLASELKTNGINEERITQDAFSRYTHTSY